MFPIATWIAAVIGLLSVRAAPAKRDNSAVDVRVAMAVIVSIIVLVAALYVVLSNDYDAENQKWAFGAIGTVVGYWLRN